MTEEQIIPEAIILNNSTSKNTLSDGKSDIAKLRLIDFSVDYAKSIENSLKKGDRKIKIREDLYNNLMNIKSILNLYGIPLSCIAFDISADNQKISHLAKVGLEIHLNENAGLRIGSNLKFDDYYVGPDYMHPIADGHKLKVYGYITKKPYTEHNIYKPINNVIDVYDIRETYRVNKPQIKKIFKPLLDITKIFEDHGFRQPPPESEFILKSDISKSNWNVFYNPNKIKIGNTYKEILSTVYDNKGEYVWLEEDLIWDGDRFIWLDKK